MKNGLYWGLVSRNPLRDPVDGPIEDSPFSSPQAE